MNEQPTLPPEISEIKRYIDLQLLHMRYLITEKLSYLTASLIFSVIAVIFGGITICYLSLSLVHLLRNYVGDSGAYAIIGIGILLIVFVVYLFRKRLILDPLARFWAQIFLEDDNTKSQ